jgi:hypothetical protein
VPRGLRPAPMRGRHKPSAINLLEIQEKNYPTRITAVGSSKRLGCFRWS